MNGYKGEERNPKCILRAYDDPLFDPADPSLSSPDPNSLPEPTMVMGEADERMACDCCGCHSEAPHR